MVDPARVTPIGTAERERPEGIRDTSAQDVRIEPNRHGRRWRLGVAVAAALAVLLLAVPAALDWARSGSAVPRERLRFATVERGAFEREIAVQGTVVAAVSPSVYTTDAGIVTLRVQAGDTVAAGTVVAVVDSPVLTSELLQEQATLDGLSARLSRQSIENRRAALSNEQTFELARLDLEAAERELRRAEQSWEYRVISRQDYEKAVDDLEKARLDFEHARETASLNQESLDFELTTLRLERDRQRLLVDELTRRAEGLTLRSPVGGIVGNVAIEQRSAVAANTPVVTVVDLSALEVEARVAEAYADDLALGMPVRVAFGGAEYDAVLSAVSPEIADNRVTTRLRFTGDTPPNLRQNQRVTARVLLESRDGVIKVARGSFFDAGAGRVAYVVDGDLLRRVPIETGSVSAQEVEILSGLEIGDAITISDIDQFDGKDTVLITD